MECSEETCLICNSSNQVPLCSLIEPFPHSEDYERETKGDKGGSTTNYILNQQLSVIFLLRKVLRLEKEFVEATLKNAGGSNPSAWNLKLCRVCSRTLEEADFVYTRLRKLHGEFAELSKLLYRRFVESSQCLTQGNGSLELQEDTPTPLKRKRPGRPAKRKRKGRWKHEETLEKNQREGIDDSLTISDRIRKEIAKGRKLGSTVKLNDITTNIEEFSTIKWEHAFVSPTPKSALKTSENSRVKLLKVQFIEQDAVDKTSENEEELSEGEIRNSTDTDFLMNDISEPVEDELSDAGLDHDPLDPEWEDADDKGIDKSDNESIEDKSHDSDSDFEINSRSRSRATRTRKRKYAAQARKKRRENSDVNTIAILKGIKMENSATYKCPTCQEVFESELLCDNHILHKHYGGKLPKIFSCSLCNYRSFKGGFRLRFHYKMKHPGEKCPEPAGPQIQEGDMPEITYEVIPMGETMSFPEQEAIESEASSSPLFNRTLDEPPKDFIDGFSIPVIQAGGSRGKTKYLVLPNSIKQIPKVFSLIESGPIEKQCEKCEKTYPTELQLRAHYERTHNGEAMGYFCPLCPKKFERIGKTLLHVQRDHVHYKYNCDRCENHYKEEMLLLAHIQRDHCGVQEPYKCVKCDIRFATRNSLNKHLKAQHKLQIASYFLLKRTKPRPAPISKMFVKRKRLQKKFPCETCVNNGLLKMKFTSEDELDAHIKRRHMGIPRPYPCPVCGKKYSKQSIVDGHMNVHTVRSDLNINDDPLTVALKDPTIFVCHPCNKQFKSRCQYNNHLKGTKHDDVRPYVCELCSKGFSGLKYLQHHQNLMHHKELNINPFKCKFCSKVLASARTLNDHIRLRHTKDANFSCPYCDVQFQHKSNMDVHINALHSKEHKFLCPHCPKTFLRDCYLRHHFQRVHSGLQPYECKYCFKKFSDGSTYNRHVEAHSNIIHTCPECGKSGFKTRHALRVHRKTLHKEIFEELERQKKLEDLVLPESSTQSNEDSMDYEATNSQDGMNNGDDDDTPGVSIDAGIYSANTDMLDAVGISLQL